MNWNKKRTELEVFNKIKLNTLNINIDFKFNKNTDENGSYCNTYSFIYECSNRYKNIIRKLVSKDFLEIIIFNRDFKLMITDDGDTYYRELKLEMVLDK